MPESIRKKYHNVHQEKDDAIAGDQILIECRKPLKRWIKVQASNKHNYFSGIINKNAYAVLSKKFTNVKKP